MSDIDKIIRPRFDEMARTAASELLGSTATSTAKWENAPPLNIEDIKQSIDALKQSVGDMRNYVDKITLIPSMSMVEPGEPYEVGREWKERLFTRPWRPLERTKWITPYTPKKELLCIKDVCYGHPEIIKTLKENLKPRVSADFANLFINNPHP